MSSLPAWISRSDTRSVANVVDSCSYCSSTLASGFGALLDLVARLGFGKTLVLVADFVVDQAWL